MRTGFAPGLFTWSHCTWFVHCIPSLEGGRFSSLHLHTSSAEQWKKRVPEAFPEEACSTKPKGPQSCGAPWLPLPLLGSGQRRPGVAGELSLTGG